MGIISGPFTWER